MNRNSRSKTIGIFAIITLLVFGLIYVGISMFKGTSSKPLTTAEATEVLSKMYKDITINTVPARKEQVNIETASVKDTLPDISKYPAQVEKSTDNYIEIFSSTEKAGEKTDGWLVETAKDFNAANIKINNVPVSVRIRGIASGMGMDYIVSGKYLPDAFTPSNELWGEMMAAKGAKVTLADKRLAGNVAGILLSKTKQDQLKGKYGSVNLKTVIDAVAANDLAMGYTNPFASSTGLNFLVSTLNTIDSKDILSEKAVQGFEKFQTNIPFVAYTTLQMRDSAKSGVLDGFILEYQTFVNSPDIKNDYIFTPFGVRHDSPIYAIGDLAPQKKEILSKFIEFCKAPKAQKLASDYGFNNLNDYNSDIKLSGDVIASSQKLWKEKKDSNNEIAAVFVADISGSMNGEPLNNLKKSLLTGAQYIGKNNSIGLVSFSKDVYVNLPIAKFDFNQRSLFTGAVTDLSTQESTAMFDGCIVASKMLLDYKAAHPNAKLMLFVLTDGETNAGHSFNDVKGMLEAFKIPVYTIGYNANVKTLQNLSNINEAASIDADTDDVMYKLQSLFNAQM